MSSPRAIKKKVQIKTYVVLLRNNMARDGEPNSSIIAVKLTRAAAELVANSIAGTWIERHVATKN
jgi:hypothetical protein